MNKKCNFIITVIVALFAFSSSLHADYPIVSHRHLADPGSMVYKGRVYLYCSNDDENPGDDKGGYAMQSIVCVSSSDLKNWTDHGVVFRVPEDASWAGKSWAPSAIERDGKFFLYFGNGGNGIGVATADSPLGPFKDPIGGKLIETGTPGVMPAEHMWLFDPMAFIDDDGQAYLYFGGNGDNNVRGIKLNKDMISVDGPAVHLNAKSFFEASWMHKVNGTYYFTYSTNPRAGMRIDYMTSSTPLGDFSYGGIVSPQPPQNNNNNHQAIFEFKGEWYQAYHNRTVAMNKGIPPVYKRNLCVDKFRHNDDGSIETMVNTEDGLRQLSFINPFDRVEAETMNAQHGIYTEPCANGGMNLSDIDSGDWIKVRGIDFGKKGSKEFVVEYSSELDNSEIELRLDDVEGDLVGSCILSLAHGSENWVSQSFDVKKVKGVHDLFIVFKNTEADSLKVDWWKFISK